MRIKWFVAAIIVLGVVLFTRAEPIGPYLLSNSTDTPDIVTSVLLMNDSKGRIHTVRFNATQPDEDWKGYVGNVSGKLVLWDAQNYSLFDWTFSTINGEVYATRGDTVTWTTLECANSSHIATEDAALNHVATQSDRINNTFSNSTHPAFFTGSTEFTQDNCSFSVYTYTNNTIEGKAFPEVLIYESTNHNVIYTAILNDSTAGFDNNLYDFQMIVSEDSSKSANIGYYFYVEVG